MEVSLLPELQRFIEDQVRAGHYESTEAILNAAVARLQTEQEFVGEELGELKSEIAVAVEEAERGDVDDWDPEDLKRRMRERTRRRETAP